MTLYGSGDTSAVQSDNLKWNLALSIRGMHRDLILSILRAIALEIEHAPFSVLVSRVVHTGRSQQESEQLEGWLERVPNACFEGMLKHREGRGNCQVSNAEIDDSIVMEETVINVEKKLVRSMIGKGSKILSANGMIPKGERLVVGENTTLCL